MKVEQYMSKLVITFFLPGALPLCVKEGDCAILRCPPVTCNNQAIEGFPLDPNGCLPIRSSVELGPLYIVQWTHLQDNEATVRKESISKPLVFSGKFVRNTEILESGDLKILETDLRFSGSYSCNVYYRYPQDSKSSSSVNLTVVSDSEPSSCDPVNECDTVSTNSLSTKVSKPLMIIGGIFGGILLIFVVLCVVSQKCWKPREVQSEVYNSQSSHPTVHVDNIAYVSSHPGIYPDTPPAPSPGSTAAYPFYSPGPDVDNC